MYIAPKSTHEPPWRP